ncbi:unnamed protein product [Parnassius apollo]|uniref:(apollo) hypothetical protein n=1 Tax=Parnassius apollo TaxID=110799 RepID=A0A8S3W8P5_PARAO|nr:unnamed protein product [Parnassius apollo]
MTPRAQREQRKRWRANKDKHLNRKQEEKQIQEVVLQNSISSKEEATGKEDATGSADPISLNSDLIEDIKTTDIDHKGNQMKQKQIWYKLKKLEMPSALIEKLNRSKNSCHIVATY